MAKNKILKSLIAFVLLLSFLAGVNENDVSAAIITYSNNGFTYSLNDVTKVAEVKGYNVTFGTDVVIPSNVSYGGDNYTVTTIGFDAFETSPITSVVIPNTIVEIKEGAFWNTSLTTIDVPGSVITIGPYAFGSTDLQEIILREGVQVIGANAFDLNTQLQTVYLPSSLINLSTTSFYGSSLTNVIIPSGADLTRVHIYLTPVFGNISNPTNTNIGVYALDSFSVQYIAGTAASYTKPHNSTQTLTSEYLGLKQVELYNVTTKGWDTITNDTFNYGTGTFEWYKKDAGGDVLVASTDTIDVVDSGTYYAKVNGIQLSDIVVKNINAITYVLDGGTNNVSNPSSYIYGTGVSTFHPASKLYSSFLGWYDAAVGGNQITSISTTQDEPVTLYAHWKSNNYNVLYDANGGTGTVTDTTDYVANEVAVVKEDTGLSKTGYTFDSWNTAIDGTGTTYAPGSNLTITGNVTLYAQWVEAVYPITYVLDGGTNDASNPTTYTFGTGVTSFAPATRQYYTFTGWYDAAIGGNAITNISTTTDGPITLYAQWSLNSYFVTYDANTGTGTVSDPTDYSGGEIAVIKASTGMTKTGYTFDSWNTAADGTGTTYTPGSNLTMTGDVTLYAQWSIGIYPITYVLDGGTNNVSNPSSYMFGTGVLTLHPATKQYSSFLGWFDAAVGGTQYTSISTTQDGPITLYAHWKLNAYFVTYDANGGTGSIIDNVDYNGGDNATVKDSTGMTKTGYTFDSWNTAADGTGTTYAPGSTVTITGNVTLYAQWVEGVYPITYVLNGGTNDASNPTTYTFGTGVTSFAPATKQYYTFTGWYDAAVGGNAITNISTTTDGAVTLYAQYSANIYNVSYDANTGTGTVTDSADYIVNDVAVVKDATGITKTGYTFDSWNTAADGSGTTYTPGSTVTITGNVTLYAQWSIGIYPITYVLDGGTNNVSNPSSYMYGTGVLTLHPATKQYSSFLGWFDAAVGGTQYTNISTTQDGPITLYAHWKLNAYFVTYDANGGTGSIIDNVDYNGGDNATVKASTGMTKTGYTFDSWNTAADGTGTSYTPGSTVTITGNVTLYAQWVEAVYPITYVLDGGTNDASNPTTYTFGTGVTTFAPATKQYYTFTGWYDAAVGGNAITNISTTTDGAVTLYAQYSANIYNVSYDANTGTGTVSDANDYTGGEIAVIKASTGMTKTGYTFDSWNTAADGSGTTYTPGSNLTMTGDVTLYAQWSIGIYPITYVLDGGTNNVSNPSSYMFGTGVLTLHPATKQYYTFLGWYDAAVGGTQYTSISTITDGPITLYAQYRANIFNVTYDANGGTGTVTDSTDYIVNDAAVVKASTGMTKTGYTFDSWNTSADGTGTAYAVGATITMTSSVTLYAQWVEAVYPITYVLDGGTNDASNPTTYTFGTGVTSFAPATKQYYTFTGWYDAAVGGNAITNISTTTDGAITLYAQWSLNSYFVTYDANTGTGTVSDPTDYSGGEIAVIKASTGMTKTGYTFDSWNTAADGSGTTYTPGSNLTMTGDVTLYAQWSIGIYPITYVLDGGTNNVSNPSSYMFGTGVLTLHPATKQYSSFLGWFDAAVGGTQYTNISTTQDGPITLYAHWKLNAYFVTYDANTGTGSIIDNVDYNGGDNATVKDSTGMTKTGYTFDSWNTAADGTGTTYAPGSTVTITGNVTLYAQWVEGVYPITYVLNGGTNDASNPTTYTFGTGVTSFAPATKQYYTFTGWYDAAVGGNAITNISTTTDGAVTLYAQYSANIYNVSYDANTGTGTVSDANDYTGGEIAVIKASTGMTKTGYTFDSWNTAADGTGTTYTPGSNLTMTGDVTLYAQWSIGIYPITYVLDGGTNNASNPTTYTFGTGVTTFAPATKQYYTFTGWYDAAAGGNAITNISTTTDGAITLYAQYSANIYNVTYDANTGTGTVSDANDYTGGEIAVVKASTGMTKTGYTFNSWNTAIDGTGTTYAVGATITMTSSVTLYAQWSIGIYPITYVLNGGTNDASNPTTYTFGTGVTSFAPATKPHSTFLGWFDAAVGGTVITTISTSQEGPITLYAQWKDNEYSVLYDANAGTGTVVDSNLYVFNANATVLDATALTNPGNEFIGWNTAVDGTGTSYLPGSTITVTGDVTLYAQWRVETFNVLYNANTGTGTITDGLDYAIGDLAVVKDATGMTKTGYTFDSWNTAADGTGVSYTPGSSITIAADVTLYAQWVKTNTPVVDPTLPITGSQNWLLLLLAAVGSMFGIKKKLK